MSGKKLFFLRLAAVLFTSISQPFLSAPFNWWPWHWFAWVPFLWAITADSGKYRLILAAIGGTASNLMIFYWIVNLLPNFSNIPLPVSIFLTVLLCAYLGLLWVLLAWFIPYLIEFFPRGWVFIAPAVLVTLEYLVPQLFPYMQGVSHYQIIPIVQLSSITGIYGVSYLLFFGNTAIFQTWRIWRNTGKFSPKYLAALALTVSFVLLYGNLRIRHYRKASNGGRVLRVGLIQSNFMPREHGKLGFSRVIRDYIEMSKEAVKRGAQWIIWSEGEFKIPFNLPHARPYLKKIAEEIGKPILLGGFAYIPLGKRRYKFYNSAIYIRTATDRPNNTRDKKNLKRSSKPTTLTKLSSEKVDITTEKNSQKHLVIGDRYDKIVLVPFGEYMPFEKYLHFIYKYINWHSRFDPGTDVKVQTLDGIPFGFLICYEAIYPQRVRQTVLKGAKLLVNITYDAWFGRTTAPYQHLMLAATRSAEFGIPLIRLATTGSSTVVDALGKTQELSPIFQRKILIYDLNLTVMPSIYAHIGDLFAQICTLVSAAALLFLYPAVRRERQKRSKGTDSSNEYAHNK